MSGRVLHTYDAWVLHGSDIGTPSWSIPKSLFKAGVDATVQLFMPVARRIFLMRPDWLAKVLPSGLSVYFIPKYSAKDSSLVFFDVGCKFVDVSRI